MIDILLKIVITTLGLFALIVLIRVILGPKFTDRIVAVNCISTLVIAIICVLSILLKEDFLIDVALIYALLGFVANVLLTRNMLAKREEKK